MYIELKIPVRHLSTDSEKQLGLSLVGGEVRAG